MIKVKRNRTKHTATVTFSLPLSEAPTPVSVAGDFNEWDPLRHPLKKRTNGTRSVTVEVSTPARLCFKYLADGGTWFNDPDATWFDTNEYGETNSVVEL